MGKFYPINTACQAQRKSSADRAFVMSIKARLFSGYELMAKHKPLNSGIVENVNRTAIEGSVFGVNFDGERKAMVPNVSPVFRSAACFLFQPVQANTSVFAPLFPEVVSGLLGRRAETNYAPRLQGRVPRPALQPSARQQSGPSLLGSSQAAAPSRRPGGFLRPNLRFSRSGYVSNC